MYIVDAIAATTAPRKVRTRMVGLLEREGKKVGRTREREYNGVRYWQNDGFNVEIIS